MLRKLLQIKLTATKPKVWYDKTKGGLSRILRILGPGLITGAADDDPSGIATYAQTGARFGYGQLWTIIFMYPLQTAVQEACARIGAVTGKGLVAIAKGQYSRKILYSIVTLVITANVVNLGADLGGMAEAARLLVPIPFYILIIGFAALILLLVIKLSYNSYAKILKWLALSLAAYLFTAIIVQGSWGQVFKATLIPHIEFNFAFLYIVTGLLGTTISPFMFFWETSEVVEEEIASKRLPQKGGEPRISKKYLKNLRLDNILGMLASELAAWFIIITTAAVLNAHGIKDIKTAADAAKALEPLVRNFPNAGVMAKLIFATGIIGLGLLAVPVLAGSASYALTEAIGWKEGLYRKFKQAHGFYGVIIIATIIGLAINFLGIDPMKALVFAAVFNCITAIPLLYVIARIGSNENIMGEYKNGKLSSSLVWLTFGVMFLSAVTLLITIIH